VTDRSDELYDYDVVRRRTIATVFERHVPSPLVVLGSRQSPDLLVNHPYPLRRRRGGGGVVLVGPGDLWMDFWIPANDERYLADVRAAALVVGSWWRDALHTFHRGAFTVHEGAAGPALACFAATGDGEVERVSVDSAPTKVVGLTQWRVREGSFISTVLHQHSTSQLASLLRDGAPFHHDSLESLGLTARRADLRDAVLAARGPWDRDVAPALA
jgi:lipoate-protein ligase A